MINFGTAPPFGPFGFRKSNQQSFAADVRYGD
jgi:hypothetical protein